MFRLNSIRILGCTAAAILLATTAPALAQECTCQGDHNYDFQVDGADLGILLGDWATQAPRSDFNHDGTVDGADLGVMLGSWGPCDAAPNDNCANALWITEGQYSFCTMGTNTDGPVPNGGCTWSPDFTHDIWYRYVAPEDGELTATMCYSVNFNAAIQIYTTPSGVAGCPGSGGTFLLGCNAGNDHCPFARPELTVPVQAGHVYTIRVTGYDGSAGSGTLTVDLGYNGSSPQNAIWLGSGGLYVVDGYTGDNPSTVDFPTTCFGGTTPGAREWISWYCFSSGTVTATTCSPDTNFDTVLTVLDYATATPTWPWGSLVVCNDDSPIAGCQIGGFNRKSHVTFPSVGGHYYYFIVSGYNGAEGNYELTIHNEHP